MQYPNWLLRYLIFQEGIHIHVEPGNIFRRKAGIKMTDPNEEVLEVAEELVGYAVTENGIEEVTIV